jgi:hypothetical protein
VAKETKRILNIRTLARRRTMKMMFHFLTRGPHAITGPAKVGALAAYFLGAGLIIWSAYLHYHLWHDLGYRDIPHIGDLFAVQTATGIVIAILIVACRRVWCALIGVGWAVLTMAAFMVSVTHGLLGFRESWSAPDAHLAFGVEATNLVVLVLAVALSTRRRRRRPASTPHSHPFGLENSSQVQVYDGIGVAHRPLTNARRRPRSQ